MNLFDRINLAHCAMRRAEEHLFDPERFAAEYFTAKMWMEYRIVDCGNGYRYVDDFKGYRYCGSLPDCE